MAARESTEIAFCGSAELTVSPYVSPDKIGLWIGTSRVYMERELLFQTS